MQEVIVEVKMKTNNVLGGKKLKRYIDPCARTDMDAEECIVREMKSFKVRSRRQEQGGDQG